MSNTLTSKTTQNVAGSTGPVVLIVAGIVGRVFDMWEIPGGEESQAAVIAFISLTVVPLVSRAVAFIRTPKKGEPTIKHFPGIILLVGAVGFCACLSGCGTLTDSWMSSVRNRTLYEVSFYDVVPPTDAVAEVVFEDGTTIPAVAATPGQDTRFDITIKAPAGVDIAEIANMAYVFEEGITVNSESTTSTQGQAAMIPKVVEANAALASQMTAETMQFLGQALEAAGPLIGMKIAADSQQAQLNAKLKSEQQAAWASTIKEMVSSMQANQGGGVLALPNE